MQRIWRVQDADGRGPWKPGFSHTWLEFDIGKRSDLPTWLDEFGIRCVMRAHAALKRGQHIGSGCTSLEQLWKWFTRLEMDRLHILGYHLVTFEPDGILAKSEIQCVFFRDVPLWKQVVIIE